MWNPSGLLNSGLVWGAAAGLFGGNLISHDSLAAVAYNMKFIG